MGSTRLPGKVMLDLRGKTVLARVIERVQQAKLTGRVVVATTTKPADNPIVEECRRLGVEIFRGSEDDVLDRYYQASLELEAEAIVRICSDSPLTDPEIIDRTIQLFMNSGADYASNALTRRYPLGLDVEVMTQKTLERCWKSARAFHQRSHVTSFVYENPAQFNILRVTGDIDYGRYRWTLDTPEDYAFLQAVYRRMHDPDQFSWHDVLALLDREPELTEVNQHILQKALQAG